MDTTTLGGGCFWCTEAVFDQLRGVTDVVSGYSGGDVPNPSYEAVCGGGTGHAEVVQITFDPALLGFEEILEIFFSIHDPTTLNRQGADVGTQYRSVVFYHSEAQREATERVIERLQSEKLWGDAPFVTQVVPFERFYPAEEYHQEYFARNPYQGYCQAVIAPKVAKFRQKYSDRLQGR